MSISTDGRSHFAQIDADQRKEWAEALRLYQNALDYFSLALKVRPICSYRRLTCAVYVRFTLERSHCEQTRRMSDFVISSSRR